MVTILESPKTLQESLTLALGILRLLVKNNNFLTSISSTWNRSLENYPAVLIPALCMIVGIVSRLVFEHGKSSTEMTRDQAHDGLRKGTIWSVKAREMTSDSSSLCLTSQRVGMVEDVANSSTSISSSPCDQSQDKMVDQVAASQSPCPIREGMEWLRPHTSGEKGVAERDADRVIEEKGMVQITTKLTDHSEEADEADNDDDDSDDDECSDDTTTAEREIDRQVDQLRRHTHHSDLVDTQTMKALSPIHKGTH